MIKDLWYLAFRILGVISPIILIYTLNETNQELASQLDILLRKFSLMVVFVIYGTTQYTLKENFDNDKTTILSSSIIISLVILTILFIVNPVGDYEYSYWIYVGIIPVIFVRHYTVAKLTHGKVIESLWPEFLMQVGLLAILFAKDYNETVVIFVILKFLSILPLIRKKIEIKRDIISYHMFFSVFFSIVPILMINMDMLIVAKFSNIEYSKVALLSRLMMMPLMGYGLYISARSKNIADWTIYSRTINKEVKLITALTICYLSTIVLFAIFSRYIQFNTNQIVLLISQFLVVLFAICFGPISQRLIFKSYSNQLNRINLVQTFFYLILYLAAVNLSCFELILAHPLIVLFHQLYKRKILI